MLFALAGRLALILEDRELRFCSFCRGDRPDPGSGPS